MGRVPQRQQLRAVPWPRGLALGHRGGARRRSAQAAPRHGGGLQQAADCSDAASPTSPMRTLPPRYIRLSPMLRHSSWPVARRRKGRIQMVSQWAPSRPLVLRKQRCPTG